MQSNRLVASQANFANLPNFDVTPRLLIDRPPRLSVIAAVGEGISGGLKIEKKIIAPIVKIIEKSRVKLGAS